MKVPRLDLGRLGGLRGVASLRNRVLHLSGRQRRIARWAGMVLLAIASFLITLRFVFPYERMRGKVIEALSEKYDVTIDDVSGGFFPGTIVFDHVVLRSRPATPEEKPSELVIDELTLDLGLDFGILGAIRKKAVFDVEAELGGGEIAAAMELSSSLVEAHIKTESLALANVPGVTAAVGLPMSGQLDADIELRLPGGKWKNAEGRIRIDCDDCTVGDGVSKMSMSSSSSSSANGRRRRVSAAAAAWSAQGVTVPKLALGETEVVVDIDKGVGEIKNFAANSKDGWLKIEGKIEFRDPFVNSLFPGCMRFKLSDDLKKRAPDFGNIEYTLSEKVRQTDGSFAIPTKGKLTELRWDVRRKCGGGSSEEEGDGGRLSGDRPGLAERPALDEVPPQGAMPIEPGMVPGANGVPVPGQPPMIDDQAAAAARSAIGEVPQPGASGPPLGQVPPASDASGQMVPPPVPPPLPVEGDPNGVQTQPQQFVPDSPPPPPPNQPPSFEGEQPRPTPPYEEQHPQDQQQLQEQSVERQPQTPSVD